MEGGKRTKGRKKIEIKRIENEIDRLITFSKRKRGIYKKASELVTLCGAEIGIIIFSPAGKPFSFGHPSIESIANRFLNRNLPFATSSSNPHPLVKAYQRGRMEELNQQLEELATQIEKEEERHDKLLKLTKGKRSWFDEPIDDDLSFDELQKMCASLEELYQNMCAQIQGSATSASASTMDNNIPVPASSTLDINQMSVSPFDTNVNGAVPHAHDINTNGAVPHGYGYGYETAFY